MTVANFFLQGEVSSGGPSHSNQRVTNSRPPGRTHLWNFAGAVRNLALPGAAEVFTGHCLGERLMLLDSKPVLKNQ